MFKAYHMVGFFYLLKYAKTTIAVYTAPIVPIIARSNAILILPDLGLWGCKSAPHPRHFLFDAALCGGD